MKPRFLQKLSQKQRKILIVSSRVLVAFLIAIALLIPVFAKQTIHKKIVETEQERNMKISIEQLKILHFSLLGNFDIRIRQLSLKDNQAKETFMAVDELRTKVQVWKGFHRTLIIKDLQANDIKVNAIKDKDYCNYHFIKGKKSTTTKSSHNYRDFVTKLLGKIGNYSPNNLKINQLNIRTDFDSLKVRYLLTDLAIHNGKGGGKAVVQEAGANAEQWKLSCVIDKKKQQYEGALVREGSANVVGSLPFLRIFEDLNVQMHEARGRFTLLKSGKKQTDCQLSGTIHNLQCQHHYIADVPARIDSVGANLQLSIFDQTIEVDSTSIVKLNRASLHPYIRFTNDTSKHILFKINEHDREAEPLFASLPADLFQILPVLSFAGTMDFNCLLDCDFGNLDSLYFDFNFTNKGRSLRIAEGLGEITRFNDQFEYTFYDHGEPVRSLWIGPNNPYFCPSHEIPELLKQSILASEDGAFFVHNGFSKSSMRQALVDDLKAGKMRRGGSTITMQLVKNLFLNRKKVLTRKFEEILLVWMIEDQNLISKDRMFEIYVNIVEWAPGVIGIGEASEFYFHKRPYELTMPECLYLATLIRAPKHYASTLNDDGTVTDIKRSELEFVADRMVTREFMTEAQRTAFDSNVKTVLKR